MSESKTTKLLDEALAIFGGTMLYKVLEDGSIYLYTEEYAHKNKDIALHSPSPRGACSQGSSRFGDKKEHRDNLRQSSLHGEQTSKD